MKIVRVFEIRLGFGCELGLWKDFKSNINLEHATVGSDFIRIGGLKDYLKNFNQLHNLIYKEYDKEMMKIFEAIRK